MSQTAPRDRTIPCCVCRLKKRKCDRVRPVCGGCRQRGAHDCSYRLEDMPPSSTHRKRVLSEESFPTPLVVTDSTSPPPPRPDLSRQEMLFRRHQRRMERARLQYALELRCQRDAQLGVTASMTGPRTSSSQVYAGPDESFNLEFEDNDPEDLFEISSSRSNNEIFHTPPFDPQPHLPQHPSKNARESHLVRLQRAVDQQTDGIKEEESIEDHPPRRQHQEPIAALLPDAQDQSMAPPVPLTKDTADSLVAIYLVRDYANLPIFDLPEFRSAYEVASAGGDLATSSSAFHGILNMIFALSCLSTSDMGDAEATYFFNQGQRLTKMFERQCDRFVPIQSYLLQCQYLNASGNPRSAWALVGFTIRMAQSMGLHSKASQDARSRKDREIARRLWHSAMIMERMLALQIGILPQTSNPLRVPLPTHLDADYIDLILGEGPSTDGERPSMVEFLTACARLYSHVEDIMAWEDELRIRHDSCAMKKLLSIDFKIFLKLDSLLYDWRSSLPSFLQIEKAGGTPSNPIVARQRNIIRVRYLYFRLRLYRPLMILGMALSTKCNCKAGERPHITGAEPVTPDSPIAMSLVRDASIKCITTAVELSGIIYTEELGQLKLQSSYEAYGNPVPPFWENVDYLYACGTVLLAAGKGLCPFFSPDTDVDRSSWTNFIVALRKYQDIPHNIQTKSIVLACLNTLKTLSDVTNRSHGAPWSIDAEALDENARTRLLVESPTSRRTAGLENDTARNNRRFLGWMESLPIDLEDGI